MNEDYLKRFQKMPDSLFLDKIQLRLARKERVGMIKRYVRLSVLTLFFAFGLLMAVSSQARADVISLFEKIGGLDYQITNNYPGGSDEDITIIEPEFLSLEDARSRFPSPVQLPTYVPQGYERPADGNVELYNWGNGASLSLKIMWRKWEENKLVGMIDFDISQCSSASSSCGMIVGDGALGEITLNGKPATLVRGAWNYDTQHYDLSLEMDIQWRYDDNTVYRLSSWSVSLEELIKMAESIP
jgi:hypothetical protein